MGSTPVVPLDPRQPDERLLERAARLLLEGELVVAPSDTVYGLLALPRSERARATLARIKQRASPFIVLVSGWEEARSWTRGVPQTVWERLHRVWPGPVTVVLPTVPEMPGAHQGGIGLRMPDSIFLTGMLGKAGEPLFSTSANRPGEPPPLEARDVPFRTTADVALILDAGPADSREPSTVVDLAHGAPRVVREGRGAPGPLLDPDLMRF